MQNNSKEFNYFDVNQLNAPLFSFSLNPFAEYLCLICLQMLMKKVDTLIKSFEVESKKMKREAAIREKDSASAKVDDKKNRNTNSSKRLVLFPSFSKKKQ